MVNGKSCCKPAGLGSSCLVLYDCAVCHSWLYKVTELNQRFLCVLLQALLLPTRNRTHSREYWTIITIKHTITDSADNIILQRFQLLPLRPIENKGETAASNPLTKTLVPLISGLAVLCPRLPCLRFWWAFVSKSLHARIQISMSSNYYFRQPG